MVMGTILHIADGGRAGQSGMSSLWRHGLPEPGDRPVRR
jgi:hypothetical protein